METPDTWSAVVPVKRVERAKTRLVGYSPAARARLVLAMAADTVMAALACPAVAGVVVVTDDEDAQDMASTLGARVVPDTPDAGLNSALEHGMTHASTLRPAAGVLAMAADLPSLRPQDLSAVVQAAARSESCFVADLTGLGTTMYLRHPGVATLPCFGARSRAAHREAGVYELREVPRSARRDVDTPVDLWDAMRMGVGDRTAAVLESLPT